ncbi:MAG: sugar porter family MFS transporter [Bacteroidota bacterium]|nr:sugar porter family MFS transporter [Bacteroidota bacterium]
MNQVSGIAHPYRFLYGNAFTAALGGLLFGFDTAVISGTIPFLTQYFHLTPTLVGWAVSSALIGCVIGALTAGRPGDYFGRRVMLRVMAILFLISALGTGLAVNLTMFVIFRFIGGLAIGGASVLSPMYISEISPARMRGRLVALSQLAIVTGILVAFFSNYLLVNTGENNWRWMLMAGAVPAIILFVLLFFVTQSPRWLVMKGRVEEAKEIIGKLDPFMDKDAEIKDIVASIDQDALSRNVFLFRKPYLRLVLIGIAVGMFNQFTGINVILYYAPSIFREAGFSNDAALFQTIMIGLTNLVFTIVAMGLIDKFGRKFLLMLGSVLMSCFLALFAIFYTKGDHHSVVLLICLLGFIASFALSQGAVIWVILSEMFPNSIRARGSSIGSFSHWVFNAAIGFLFPIASGYFGIGTVFFFFTAGTVLSFFFFMKFLVETKGKSLEEIEKLSLKK